MGAKIKFICLFQFAIIQINAIKCDYPTSQICEFNNKTDSEGNCFCTRACPHLSKDPYDMNKCQVCVEQDLNKYPTAEANYCQLCAPGYNTKNIYSITQWCSSRSQLISKNT